jgi:hypothetical protein
MDKGGGSVEERGSSQHHSARTHKVARIAYTYHFGLFETLKLV